MNLGHVNSNGFDLSSPTKMDLDLKATVGMSPSPWESQKKKAMSLRVGFVAEPGVCALLLSRTKFLAKFLRRFLCIR
jgi:hypothetical protein